MSNYIFQLSAQVTTKSVSYKTRFGIYIAADAYELAAQPKELYIVPNAGHVDLYDKTDVIPFDKLDAFFTEHLMQS